MRFRLGDARESAPLGGVLGGIPREVLGKILLLALAHFGYLRIVPLGVMLVLVVANRTVSAISLPTFCLDPPSTPSRSADRS